MRILIVSTLKRNVAPTQFASRSRIIFELTSGLVKRGHEVSILGTADSNIPGASLIPIIEKGWVDLAPTENSFIRDSSTLVMLSKKLIEIQDEFDIIHSHLYPDIFLSTLDQYLNKPLVVTLHAIATEAYLRNAVDVCLRTNFVALSQNYKKLLNSPNVSDVVYNGVDANLYSFQDKKSDYLFWLARLPKSKDKNGEFIDPKGVKWAIKLSQETGQKLILGGIVEDKSFYEKDVAPFLGKNIEWVGDVGPEQSIPVEKTIELMKNAKAFLNTINEEEPFGLTMIEAMSCGTPVITFNRGSVPEIVVDGKTGFTVPPEEKIEGLKEALLKIGTIKPEDCRKRVEENFTLEKMVGNYEAVYNRLLNK